MLRQANGPRGDTTTAPPKGPGEISFLRRTLPAHLDPRLPALRAEGECLLLKRPVCGGGQWPPDTHTRVGPVSSCRDGNSTPRSADASSPEGWMSPDLGAHPGPQMPTRPLLSAAQVSTAARTRLAEPQFFSPDPLIPLLWSVTLIPRGLPCPVPTVVLLHPMSVSPGPWLSMKQWKGGTG